MAAVGARLVGERDAVLGEQLAGLRDVGENRPVRIEEVRVRLAAAAPHADEAEVAVHLPFLLRHARAQQPSRALLGAQLTAGVEARLIAPARGERALLAKLCERAHEARATELPHEHDEHHNRRAERELHAG